MLNSKKNDSLVAALSTVGALTGADQAAGRSLWSDARRRFLRNRAAVISLVLLLMIAAICVAGPWVLPNAFDSADWDSMSNPPTLKNAHFWGTDDAGRDLLVRCLVGGRISLMVGLLATLASVSLGIQEPMTSWGVLIQDGAKAMEVSPWMLLFPGALLSITLYCFNFIGDGMRDALDPKER